VRDIKGVFRNYRTSELTEKATGLILRFLNENSPNSVVFLLDSQISKSGLLAGKLRENIREAGLNGDARTSKHVDYDLKNSKDIVASSDGAIIDASGKVVNFLHCMASRFAHLQAGIKKNEFS